MAKGSVGLTACISTENTACSSTEKWVTKLLFDDALSQATGKFFKECSKPGTALENAVSREEAW